MSMNGIDVSHWQKGIDLSTFECDFVIMKATQGTSYVDPCCDKFYQAAKSSGKKLGVYHYFAGGDPTEEAIHFVNSITGYIGEAILVLDWESESNSKFKQGVSVAKVFLDKVYELTGVKPLIYMSKSVCRDYDWSSVVEADYGLWMAQYANSSAVTAFKDAPWTDTKGLGAFKSYAIHQYSSHGNLAGYLGNLDLDIAYMTVDAWDSYAKRTNDIIIVPKIEYYDKYDETLIGILQVIGVEDTSYDFRKKIAEANSISNYSGTAEQNLKLISLAKEGKLIKP